VTAAIAAAASTAAAQQAQPPPMPTPDDAITGAAADDDGQDLETAEVTVADQLAALRDQLADVQAQLSNQEQAARLRRPPPHLSGYVDVGFFVPLSSRGGAGVVQDTTRTRLPQYANYRWAFYGDLLSTQVNSAGEVADLGDLPGVDRYDSINSNGNSSFIINEVNQTISAGLTPQVLLTGSVNVTPRQGREFALGDSLNVDLAQLEWLPGGAGRHSVFVGKFDSVLGHEYRTRKPDKRFGITPTLLHRYTSGTAIGIKVRSKLVDDHVVLAASLTNGSFGTEQFHFHDEIDSNQGKTVSARGAGRFQLGPATIEVAVSGQVGAQDGGGDATAYLYGVDLEISTVATALRAQWLRGHAPGDVEARAYRLELANAGYLEATHLLGHRVGVLLRAELRDAVVSLPLERVYVTRSWRAVGGVRLVLAPGLVAKVEYLHNGEFGEVPQFRNDVATSSLVISY
jgi:hypothetical protein